MDGFQERKAKLVQLASTTPLKGSILESSKIILTGKFILGKKTKALK